MPVDNVGEISSTNTHYTCTSSRTAETSPGSTKEHIDWEFLDKKIRERIGRKPKDGKEAVILAEQVISECAREEKRRKRK